MTLADLHQKHKNDDIYVLGSGPSLGYISPGFLKDKVVICVNNTIDYVSEAHYLYLIAKEPTTKMQKQVVEKGGLLVTCPFRCGNRRCGKNVILDPDKTVMFAGRIGCVQNERQRKYLEKSASTLYTGVHLAAFMGAKAVVLIGHDCGTLDGEVHASDYDKVGAQTPPDRYKSWMCSLSVEHNTLRLKKILKELYDVEVYSLNPFINFGLEGHKYESFS